MPMTSCTSKNGPNWKEQAGSIAKQQFTVMIFPCSYSSSCGGFPWAYLISQCFVLSNWYSTSPLCTALWRFLSKLQNSNLLGPRTMTVAFWCCVIRLAAFHSLSDVGTFVLCDDVDGLQPTHTHGKWTSAKMDSSCLGKGSWWAQ